MSELNILFLGKYDDDLLSLEEQLIDINCSKKQTINVESFPDVIKYTNNIFQFNVYAIVGDVKPSLLLKKLISQVNIIIFTFNINKKDTLEFLTNGWGPIVDKIEKPKSQERILIGTNSSQNLNTEDLDHIIFNIYTKFQCSKYYAEKSNSNFKLNNQIDILTDFIGDFEKRYEKQEENYFNTKDENSEEKNNENEDEDEKEEEIENTSELVEIEKDYTSYKISKKYQNSEIIKIQNIDVSNNNNNINDIQIPPFIEYQNERYLITKICDTAFSNNKTFQFSEKIRIGHIDTNNFRNNFSPTNIILKSNSVIEFLNSCFTGMNNLENLEIEGEQIIIKNNCFNNCFNKNYSRSKMTIKIQSRSKIKIEDNCFNNCTSLEIIEIVGDQIYIGNNCFNNCFSTPNQNKNHYSPKIFKITSNSHIEIGNNCFNECNYLEKLEIAGNLITIDKEYFKELSSSTPFIISKESEIIINSNELAKIKSLEELKLQSTSQINLNSRCFSGIKNLQKIRIEGPEINIREYCFDQCSSLKSVFLEILLYHINSKSFIGCNPDLKFNITTSKIDINEYYEYFNELDADETRQIFAIENKKTNAMYIAKVFNTKIETSSLKEKFLNHMATYSNLQCPSISMLHSFSFKDMNNEEYPMIISEYHGIMSLSNAMKEKQLSKQQEYNILLGILLGLKYLQSNKIEIKKLTTKQILLDENFYPYIDYYEYENEDINDVPIKNIIYQYLLIAFELITDQPPKEVKNQQTISNFFLIKNEKIQKFFYKCISIKQKKDPSQQNFESIYKEFTKPLYIQFFQADINEICSYLKLFGIYELTERIKINGIWYEISKISLTAKIVECEKTKNDLEIFEYVKSGDLQCNIIQIESNAFLSNSKIKSLSFNQNSHVFSIGNSAFENLLLETISLPSSVEELGSYCFSGLKKLNKIEIKSIKLTTGKGCFENCTLLTSISFPNTKKIIIGDESFKGCINLKQFSTTQAELINLGNFCFCGSTNLQNATFDSKDITIGDNCFNECNNLTSILFKNSNNIVIGSSAFENCSKLSNINISATSKLTIGDLCFSSISELQRITLVSKEITIGNQCFTKCQNLLALNIQNSNDITIGSNTFEGCLKLTKMNLMSSNKIILGKSCFHCVKNLKEITINCNIIEINDNCFEECENLNSISIQKVSDAKICSFAFKGCISLTEFKLNCSSRMIICKNCFSGTNKLTTINLTSDYLQLEDFIISESCVSTFYICCSENKKISSNAFRIGNSTLKPKFIKK